MALSSIPILFLLLLVPVSSAPAQAGSAADSARGETADTAGITSASGELREYTEPYHLVESLNGGLPALGTTPNLQTPQAALEYFVRAVRAEQYAAAGRALNLNLFPPSEQPAAAPVLARQLYYVLDKQLGFDWEGLPDRPDGMVEQPSTPNDPIAGQPRRSIRLGMLSLDGRDVVIRLQRVKPGDAAPVWVFSPQTVENVRPLYRQYGPGPIQRFMPAWAQTQVLGQTALWAWLALLVLFALGALLAVVLRRFTKHRLARSDSHWIQGMGESIATPVAVVAGFLLVYSVAKLALSLPLVVTLTLLILTILAFVWLAMRVIEYLTTHIARDQVDDIAELSGDEKNQQQRWLTYLSVGRRVLVFLLFLVAVGVIVTQFEPLRTLGISLMASAGLATVILGIAAQPVLGNIVAGLQIALSRPVRIGDSVVYEGDWGYVEDVTYTYVLIQTWDHRRLVVPLQHLITHPFENWTIRNAHLVKPIHLYADFSLDVDRVREKFSELVRSSADWDEKKEPIVQVVAVEDDTMELRALCSAKDASTAWDLHCRLREELVAWLRDLDGGKHLPSQRISLDEVGEGQVGIRESRRTPV